jgi:segregation and condensation protein A
MTTEEARAAVEGTSEGGAPEVPSPGDSPILRLPAFEGPLDLLLHLIEKQDLDITAVSLLAVTEQYLAHLRAAATVNVGALADFIAIGARLLLLKSRALLPREDQADDGDAEAEAADPEALVAALQ